MSATDLLHVLRECRGSPVFVKGNYARAHAIDVAMAASLGLITSESEYGEYGNRWHLTRRGIEVLNAEAKSRSDPVSLRDEVVRRRKRGRERGLRG